MKNMILTAVFVISTFFTIGCGNLSPRNSQKIDNSGKIGEVESMQNSMKAELGKLQSQADIQNSRLDRIQQGIVNMQHNEENSGVQILSGSGGLIVALVGFVCICIIAVHYRSTSVMHEKTANLLAERIVNHGDEDLINSVFEASIHTDVNANLLAMVKKHKMIQDVKI